MTTMDLSTFLLARLDEDEQIARAATGWATGWTVDAAPDGTWYIDPGHQRDDTGNVRARADADHIARHDPARVLAEVEAKRQIVAPHRGTHRCEWGDVTMDNQCTARLLRLLALPYADHPDYLAEWKPAA